MRDDLCGTGLIIDMNSHRMSRIFILLHSLNQHSHSIIEKYTQFTKTACCFFSQYAYSMVIPHLVRDPGIKWPNLD